MEEEKYKQVFWRIKSKKFKKPMHLDSGKFLIPERLLLSAVNMFDPNRFDVTVEDTDLYVPSEEE